MVSCDLKRDENELKTTNVSDQRLSLVQNVRFQKRVFSACFQDENLKTTLKKILAQY
jgi:hypothetical protein